MHARTGSRRSLLTYSFALSARPALSQQLYELLLPHTEYEPLVLCTCTNIFSTTTWLRGEKELHLMTVSRGIRYTFRASGKWASSIESACTISLLYKQRLSCLSHWLVVLGLSCRPRPMDTARKSV